MIERVSIEVTNRCAKRCSFCYNGSRPAGTTTWAPESLVGFVTDCASNGLLAVSFGGGEPLEWEGLFETLAALRGVLFRSVTTNGLLLDGPLLDRLVEASPDKVHVSVHFPQRRHEVERVVRQVGLLAERGVRSGVNLLVARSNLDAARSAAERMAEAGIGPDRIVYLPMRRADTPSPAEVARVAAGPFQSTTCLSACGKSPRFCSVSWDRQVGWCSYTAARRQLVEPTWVGLHTALGGLGLSFCGGRADA